MHKSVKSEHCFAVTGAKRVAVFQASLKLVREEACAQLSKNDKKKKKKKKKKCSTPKDQKGYEKEGDVNKKMTH